MLLSRRVTSLAVATAMLLVLASTAMSQAAARFDVSPSAHPGHISRTAGGKTPSLKYFGGQVLPTTTTYAIFWLPAGYSFEPYGDDSRYERLIVRYLQDVGGTPFYNILTQYSVDAHGNAVAGGPILNSSTFAGSVIDPNPYPKKATKDDPLYSVDFAAEIQKVAAVQGWSTDPPSTFFVFTGSGVQFCFRKGNLCTADNWCAFHTGTGSNIVFAAVGDSDGLPSCDIGGGPNGDDTADTAISWASHEQFEAVTDPFVCTAWAVDCTSIEEIGDLCQWRFENAASDGSTVILHGNPYRIQPEWSNADKACVTRYTAGPRPHPTPSPTVTPVPAKKCPKNASKKKGRCVCKKGYVMKKGKCVKKNP